VTYRLAKQPLIVGGVALGLGYGWASLRRVPRAVSPELMAFHRKEQVSKLKVILRSFAKFQRVDNFSLRSRNAS
jgi:hypothetical protein